jgi:hypothetical protein
MNDPRLDGLQRNKGKGIFQLLYHLGDFNHVALIKSHYFGV